MTTNLYNKEGTYDESDWGIAKGAPAYYQSKILAEKAAWKVKFVECCSLWSSIKNIIPLDLLQFAQE